MNRKADGVGVRPNFDVVTEVREYRYSTVARGLFATSGHTHPHVSVGDTDRVIISIQSRYLARTTASL